MVPGVAPGSPEYPASSPEPEDRPSSSSASPARAVATPAVVVADVGDGGNCYKADQRVHRGLLQCMLAFGYLAVKFGKKNDAENEHNKSQRV